MKLIPKAIKQIFTGKWEVRKCLWPYPEGYATYHTGKRMILDTGLSKEEATAICKQLNGK